MRKFFWRNPVVETSFLKFSQPAAGAKNFGENTVAELSFPDEKKDCRWNKFWLEFNFSSKNDKKKSLHWKLPDSAPEFREKKKIEQPIFLFSTWFLKKTKFFIRKCFCNKK
jgi:hypothetical protein